MTSILTQKVKNYSAWVGHLSHVEYDRALTLKLESGRTAFIYFQSVLPQPWLTPIPNGWNLYMLSHQY